MSLRGCGRWTALTFCSFLDDIARIATRAYEPSDADVVRARLRTLGVQEHRLVMERSGTPSRPACCCAQDSPVDTGVSALATNDVSREWMIYDVGGSRTSVRAPFSPCMLS